MSFNVNLSVESLHPGVEHSGSEKIDLANIYNIPISSSPEHSDFLRETSELNNAYFDAMNAAKSHGEVVEPVSTEAAYTPEVISDRDAVVGITKRGESLAAWREYALAA